MVDVPPATIRQAPVQPQTVQPPPVVQSAQPQPLKVPEVRPVAPVDPEEAPAAPKREAYTSRSLLKDLRNPATLREAIIMREVLGPPKAFQLS